MQAQLIKDVDVFSAIRRTAPKGYAWLEHDAEAVNKAYRQAFVADPARGGKVPVAFRDKKEAAKARAEAIKERAKALSQGKKEYPLMNSKQWFCHQKTVLDWLRASATDPETPAPTYTPVGGLDEVSVSFSSPTAKKFVGECKRYLAGGCQAGDDGFTWCDIHDTP